MQGLEKVQDNVMNCKLCLTVTENSLEVFGEEGLKLGIAEIVSKHFGFVLAQDHFTQKICLRCWHKLQDFHIFYLEVEKRHESYMDNYLVDQFEPPQMKDEIYIPMVHDTQEQLSSSIREIQFVAIEEPVETDAAADDSKEDTTPKKTKDKTSPMEDVEIPDYCAQECPLCEQPLTTWFQMKKHFKYLHDSEGYVQCNQCELKLTRKFLFVDHLAWHKNPDQFKCEQCDQAFKFHDNLKKHMHKHSTQDQRVFQCHQCDKSYARKGLLNHHIKSAHLSTPEAVKCPQCAKCLSSKWALKIHLQIVHEGRIAEICEICAKKFSSRAVYEKHKKTVHAVIPLPKVKCPDCENYLNESSLRSHAKTCSGRADKSTHVCKTCKKTYPNIKALQGHIKFVHGPRKTYTCNICSKTFRESYRLKEHMAVHTGDILYTCPFYGCGKTCNSKANMYKHRKQKHAVN